MSIHWEMYAVDPDEVQETWVSMSHHVDREDLWDAWRAWTDDDAAAQDDSRRLILFRYDWSDMVLVNDYHRLAYGSESPAFGGNHVIDPADPDRMHGPGMIFQPYEDVARTAALIAEPPRRLSDADRQRLLEEGTRLAWQMAWDWEPESAQVPFDEGFWVLLRRCHDELARWYADVAAAGYALIKRVDA